MNSIKVSVIIPVYNTEQYLTQCLDSVFSQTINDYEVICVDDGSKDGSIEILKKYRSLHENMTILYQNHEYAGVARNLGLKVAKGEYVFFMDSDDFIEPDLLALAYREAKEKDNDVCIFHCDKYHDEKREYIKWDTLQERYLPHKDIFSKKELGINCFRFEVPGPYDKIIKREFLYDIHIEFQELHNSNDLYFSKMICVYAKRISIMKERPLYHYRVGLKHNLQSVKNLYPLEVFYAYRKMHQTLVEQNLFDGQLKCSFLNFLIEAIFWSFRARGYNEESIIAILNEVREYFFPIIENNVSSLSLGNLVIYGRMQYACKMHSNEETVKYFESEEFSRVERTDLLNTYWKYRKSLGISYLPYWVIKTKIKK